MMIIIQTKLTGLSAFRATVRPGLRANAFPTLHLDGETA